MTTHSNFPGKASNMAPWHIKWALKAGPVSGGFKMVIEVAQRLQDRADEMLALRARMRTSHVRSAWGDVFTVLRWMGEHPDEEPTCARVWPQIFGGRR